MNTRGGRLSIKDSFNPADGYVGASALMEIGLAGYLGKQIFVMYPISETERYRHEIFNLGGVVIDGDITRISPLQ